MKKITVKAFIASIIHNSINSAFICIALFFLLSCDKNILYNAINDNKGFTSAVLKGWYKNFLEPFGATPVYNPGSTCYYSSVQYDENHFGNNVNDYLTGSSGDTYQVLPYYKMWVGDGSNTDFAYSGDGITWIRPLVSGQNILGAGSANRYHPTVVYSETGFPSETKQNPLSKYRMWNWYSTTQIIYYESVDGISFTAYPLIFLDYTKVTADPAASTDTYSISILYRPSNNPKYEGWVDVAGEQYYMTSNDCITWQRSPGLAPSDNKITHSGKDGLTPHEFHCGGWPSIVYFDGKYRMWYSSNIDGISDATYNQAISYAESNNGVTWELVEILPSMGINATPAGDKSNGILRINDGNTWRTNRTYCPTVIYSPDKFVTSDNVLHGEYKDFKMWFTGDGPAGRRIFYASFNEP